MNPARPPLPPHARRRRAIQQRQTIVIGGLVAALLLVALVAAAIYAQILPAPFDREFSADPESDSAGAPAADAQPCPPEGAEPRALDEITTNVFNATERAGLASTTAQELVAAGVVVNQQGNWGGGTYEGAVRIVAGSSGVVPAYSVARVFPSAQVAMDDRTDESVDIILGDAFDAPLPPEEIGALDPSAPIAAPEECVPVEEVPTAG